MRLVAYPHIKKEHQSKFHREMHKLAYPKTHDNKIHNPEELIERVKAALNGK